MITSVAEFVRYFEGVRRRTLATVARVTPEALGWAPRPAEFTCGDVIRHLAGAERFFVTKVLEDRFTDDLDPGPPLGRAETLERLEAVHRRERERLAAMDDARLALPLADLDGGRVKAWRFLMAMAEHEVHHRSQLDSYLSQLGIEPPQLYGYRMEAVLERVGGA